MTRRIIAVVHGLLIAGFFALLWTPLVAKALRWGKNVDLAENRVLAQRPSLRTTPLAELPKKIDAYLRDRLPFRSLMVRCNGLLRHKYLGLGSAQVLVGKDGWLFFDLDRCQSADYMGLRPFTPEQLEQWRTYLERRAAYLEARGVRYVFMAAPNQPTIYPEKLPENVRIHRGRTRYEQLTAYLAAHSSFRLLDLVEPIRAAKRQGLVYFRTDSHWNGLGCYVAMDCLCRRLQTWFPTVQWKPLGTDWQITETSVPSALWPMLGIDPGPLPPERLLVRQSPPAVRPVDVVMPSNWPPVPPGQWCSPRAFESGRPGKRLVVLADSFFGAGLKDATYRPLADHFARSLFVVRTDGRRTPHDLLRTLVDQEHPDVVVEELMEWYLCFLPDPPVVAPFLEAGNVAASARGVKSPDHAGVAYALDGDPATATRLAGPLTIELVKPYELHRIGVLLDARAPQEAFAVDTSTDNTHWAPVVERCEPRGAGWQQLSFPARTVQYIRLRPLAVKPGAGLSLAELDARCPVAQASRLATRPLNAAPPLR
jgi:hypothetical protein